MEGARRRRKFFLQFWRFNELKLRFRVKLVLKKIHAITENETEKRVWCENWEATEK